jgi:hypothetical protein
LSVARDFCIGEGIVGRRRLFEINARIGAREQGELV